MASENIPLRYKTPSRWAKGVLQEPLKLLNDHAYLERKAATNALDLLNRWAMVKSPANWISRLSTVARDETVHLNRVSRLLAKKGGALEPAHKSVYASDLRKLVRNGQGKFELLDRMLVSALIEARSCERFQILARTCPDKELRSFYKNLCASEMGHFKVFLRLAEDVLDKKTVQTRWKNMLTMEAKIIKNQPVGPSLHSGTPSLKNNNL